jgi:dipeptidyl aminopeptidase/acylaminoacyl peptidase
MKAPTRLRRAAALAGLIALALIGAASTGLAGPPQAEKRLLAVDDIFNIKQVSDPRISPDGEWVAFTVSQMDAAKDGSDTDVWMAPIGGGEALRLTTSDESESSPRWSPDGRWLAFLSGRDGNRTQVWLLPRAGGEGRRLTSFSSGVSSMAWSPDGRRLALVVRDPKEDEDHDGDDASEAAGSGDDADEESPKPIVVTRLEFKEDGRGYLDDRRNHIHSFDIGEETSVQITGGPYDDSAPAWSPDGRSIAFVSNRTEEPDANVNSDIFIVAAEAGAEPRKLTAWEGDDSSPAFTPDGRYIVYSRGGDPDDAWYDTNDIALIAAGGGEPRILTEGLDRNVGSPRITTDRATVVFTLEDRGSDRIGSVPLTGGEIVDLVAGERSLGGFDIGADGELVVLESQPHYPAEVSRVVAGELRRITRFNDELLAGIELAPVSAFETESSGGVSIQGFLTLPPGAPEGERLPTILRIHGGPVSQFAHAFNFEWQLLAAHGYAVVGANPRGSSGRGRDFSRAIYADWGNVDFDDVMAAVDHVIAIGVADPERLGVGGWSYGGILTNYVITKTKRFKAAISGASEVNYTANYGHDHYQYIWEKELGLPWENTELWIRLSPFFHVANVTTPTLVMGGQEDWNVPIQNSDQLYQALRRLGVPTQLVVYPGESHGINRPSFQTDRYERYLAWYDRWVKGEESVGSGDDGGGPAAGSELGGSLAPSSVPH